MKSIDISDEIKSLALRFQSIILPKLKDGKNYTKLEAEERFYHGYVGELVMREYVKGLRKKITYTIRLDGKADENGEFRLFTKVGEKTLDVKAASQSFHSRIMMPADQAEVHTSNYYGGVKLNGNIGEIWGVCSGIGWLLKEDGFDKNRVPTLYRDLGGLADIDTLLAIVEEGEFSDNIEEELKKYEPIDQNPPF